MKVSNSLKQESIIKQLPVHEAQKIAAGEVVERPANIVKELIENALDAQANQITVFVQDGGKKLIRVVDNGHGMSEHDASLCFNHHATSKIDSINDIAHITSFGFRGEALSSIASVSTVQLITRKKTAQHGTQLTLIGGSIEHTKAVSCPVGTDLTITDLFYNVPARKKFLKTRETEWRQILALFHAFCLSYRTIHFKLVSENKSILNCPPTETIQERIAQLWDHTFAQQMLPFEKKEHGTTVMGAISNHHYYRYDRTQLYIFVNNRWIKNQALSRALIKGYVNVLPTGRFPAGCIFITIDTTLVDINVHPRKEEVQFLHPRRIEHSITSGVKETLENHLSSYLEKKEPFTSPLQSFSFQDPFLPEPDKEPLPSSSYKPGPYVSLPPKKSTTSLPLPEELSANAPQSLLSSSASAQLPEMQLSSLPNETPNEQKEAYRLIGHYNKTYILLEKEDGLFVIDQHAAHERILYEQFSNRFESIPTVKLLFPQIITVTKHEIQLLEPHKPLFKQHGILFDSFGHNQLVIEATPVHLQNSSLQHIIKQAISWIIEYANLEKEPFKKTIHEKLRAHMACKAAVKAGDSLSTDQMHQLIEDLSKTPNKLTCPHGRPTGWFLSLDEIEKKFKRNYR